MSVRPHPKQKTDSRYSSTWIIDYYPNGRAGGRRQLYWDGTEAQAWEAESSWRAKSRKVETLVFPKIAEVIPHFLDHYRLDHQPEGVNRTTRSIKILLRFFGRLQFTAINHQLIEQYKRDRMDLVKPTTINKELAALSSLCKWALDMGYCEEIRIRRFPPKLTRAPIPDVPPREEVIKLIRAIPWPKQGLFWCLYHGGLRSAEGRTLKAEHINLAMGVMIITGKGNKQRIVPVVDDLLPVLERRLAEIDSGWLWPGPNGTPLVDLRPTIKWAKKRAGINRPYTPHTFRHAFGSHATMAGVNLRTLQEVMGHSSSQVTELYSRLAASALSKEMRKFASTTVANEKDKLNE